MESKSGESLVETLASILVVALSAMVLATFVMSAANLGRASKNELEEYFTEKNMNADRSGSPATITVEITPEGGSTVQLGSYALVTGSDSDALRSYYRP